MQSSDQHAITTSAARTDGTVEGTGTETQASERSYGNSYKLQHLRALVAVAEAGTFSEAALDLDTSQSTVSNAIAELERELGVRLLERGRFGARPTEVGERVVGHVRRLEGVLDAIRQEASLDRGDLCGRVRVNAFRSAATHVLPGVLARLRSDHPGVDVIIQEAENLAQEMTSPLLDGRADVAITTASLAGESLFWELFRDPFVAVVPEDWPGASGEEVALEEVLSQRSIIGSGACWSPLMRHVREVRPSFTAAYTVSQDSTMLSMVAQGLGVALMPSLAIDALPAGTRRLALTEGLERRVGVALAPSALKVPAVRAFLSVLSRFFPDGEIPPLGVDSRSN